MLLTSKLACVRQSGDSPLGNAAFYGKVDCIRALVELGAELEAKDGVRAAPGCQAWRCVMLLTLAGA